MKTFNFPLEILKDWNEKINIEKFSQNRQIITLKDILSSKEFQETDFILPMAIGMKTDGKPYIADLTKMPHLLIVGKPGNGTSVLLDAILTSLLYSKKPDEVKFVLIDPDMVAFTHYNNVDIPYLAKNPAIDESEVSDIKDIYATLHSLCVEMNKRYKLLLESSSRNLKEYNAGISNGKTDLSKFPVLPYIVVMIDRYESPIMTAGKEIEKPILMLAQKGRAVGIHLILSTYRPTSEFISPAIGANFPARITFKLDTEQERKLIIDQAGAECLKGRGDMLVCHSYPTERVQGAYIDYTEIEQICEYISKLPNDGKPYFLPEVHYEQIERPEEHADYLLKDCALYMLETKLVSISAIQRNFHIGYNRATKIIDQLQKAGVISSRPRAMLLSKEEIEKLLS